MEDPSIHKLQIRLPVKIRYSALEELLQEKLVGEKITTENKKGKATDYAEILDVILEQSPEENYDIALNLQFRMLTTLFRNKEGGVILHAVLDFDPEDQEVFVSDFKLEGKTKNWLMNKSIQTVANTFIHKKIRNKMRLDFRPHIKKQLAAANDKLENPLEPVEGLGLSGYLKDFKICEILPGESMFLIIVEIKGGALVEIRKFNF